MKYVITHEGSGGGQGFMVALLPKTRRPPWRRFAASVDILIRFRTWQLGTRKLNDRARNTPLHPAATTGLLLRGLGIATQAHL